jgi:Na+/H+-dicarboxylate symporter
MVSLLELPNVNVPASAIGLLLPFDRILDRFRTMTNVCGDLVCAITVDHLQKIHERNGGRLRRRKKSR